MDCRFHSSFANIFFRVRSRHSKREYNQGGHSIFAQSPVLAQGPVAHVTCHCKLPPRGVRVRPCGGRTDEASQVYGTADYWRAACRRIRAVVLSCKLVSPSETEHGQCAAQTSCAPSVFQNNPLGPSRNPIP